MKSKKKIFLIFILQVFLVLKFATSAHYIVGYVENAKDGTSPNGMYVRMHRLDNQSDYITGIIGPVGSGVDNVYILDCELLKRPCDIGDTLRLFVEQKDDYVGLNFVDVLVSGYGFDLADNLTINSPPKSNNSYPKNFDNISGVVNFNCSSSDLDGNLESVSLYGNWGIGWHLNETANISGHQSSKIFTKYLPDGVYQYYCRAKDEKGIFSFPDIPTQFTIDSTPPTIWSVYYNETNICGAKTIKIYCNTSDNLTGIKEVKIEVDNSNLTAMLQNDLYYAEYYFQNPGTYQTTCYAIDYSLNVAKKENNLSIYYSNVELSIKNIYYSNYAPVEKEDVNLTFEVNNDGCSNASEVLISLYKNNRDSNNLINQSIENIYGTEKRNISFIVKSEIGKNLFVLFVDSNNSFTEENELDNIKNTSFYVSSWQLFYGNLSINTKIGINEYNISVWKNSTNNYIFVTDKEAEINWANLQAIGRDKNGNPVSNDFSKIDSIIEMENLEDSVNFTFKNHFLKNYTINQKLIENVPVINSTNESVFLTGILWDTTKDTNGYFDTNDKEDIIFITEIFPSTRGSRGTYDYEVLIPVKIREIYKTDIKSLYFYYDLD